MARVRHQLTISLFLAVALLLAACAQPTPEPTPVLETVGVQLSWFHNVEFSGFYLAVSKGYYAEEGLAVEITPGGTDAEGNFINPVAEVVAGNAMFGVSDGGALLVERAAGSPAVAIGSIYQLSPVAFTSLADRGIERPQDLVGQTVAIDEFSTGPIFRALLASQGIDPADINVIQRTDFTTDLLTSGEVDVLDGWITNEVTLLEAGGTAVNFILPSDYGIDMYPDVIFTTEETIANRPELVQAFVRATLRGVQDALSEPAEAAALAVEYDPTLDPAGQEASMERSLPLLSPPGSQPGVMRPEVWELTHEILLNEGILSAPLTLEDAYTTTFVDAVLAE
jgi:ABC-type nitrate/sulfonate/bicarbonate transport system substrate-binding protein